MLGEYTIKVSNNKISYNLNIKRGITIIRGKSATGKTELVRLIQMYQRNGASSGVKLESSVPCQAIWRSLEDAVKVIKSVSNEILFFDETDRFIVTEAFAKAVKGCDCYIVIINREDLPNLPYSVREIKQLVFSSKKAVKVNTLEELYPIVQSSAKYVPKLVVTEDAKTGNQMFSRVYKCECIGAGGNSEVITLLKSLGDCGELLIIADGAAFGAYYSLLCELVETKQCHTIIWLPESFEYLLLKSGCLPNVDKEKLDFPEQYADTKQYFSWEQYFTRLLEEYSEALPDFKYSKDILRQGYFIAGNLRRFKNVIPECIRPQ